MFERHLQLKTPINASPEQDLNQPGVVPSRKYCTDDDIFANAHGKLQTMKPQEQIFIQDGLRI